MYNQTLRDEGRSAHISCSDYSHIDTLLTRRPPLHVSTNWGPVWKNSQKPDQSLSRFFLKNRRIQSQPWLKVFIKTQKSSMAETLISGRTSPRLHVVLGLGMIALVHGFSEVPVQMFFHWSTSHEHSWLPLVYISLIISTSSLQKDLKKKKKRFCGSFWVWFRSRRLKWSQNVPEVPPKTILTTVCISVLIITQDLIWTILVINRRERGTS